MSLRKPGEVEDQIMCSSCSSYVSLLKPHFVVLFNVLLGLALLMFSGFFGHSLFVTFVVLIVSTFTSLKFTKQKLGLNQNPVFEGTSTSSASSASSTSTSSEVEVLGEERITDKEIITHEELRSENEIVTTKKEAGGVDETAPDYIVKSRVPSDLSSEESESMDLSSTSEDSDADWPFPNNMDRIPECSCDSISDDDDENLIEIPLSSDDYIFGIKEEQQKLKSQLSLSQLSSDHVFHIRAY
ncbi:hypothetical protein Syun_010705 [Stephania yunnanensis]|uniref:Transmembrane protein n=1 Tax=Stephania yunnanensis TaxID=152371 RepID=A0AAP0PTH7_9MAGN